MVPAFAAPDPEAGAEVGPLAAAAAEPETEAEGVEGAGPAAVEAASPSEALSVRGAAGGVDGELDSSSLLAWLSSLALPLQPLGKRPSRAGGSERTTILFVVLEAVLLAVLAELAAGCEEVDEVSEPAIAAVVCRGVCGVIQAACRFGQSFPVRRGSYIYNFFLAPLVALFRRGAEEGVEVIRLGAARRRWRWMGREKSSGGRQRGETGWMTEVTVVEGRGRRRRGRRNGERWFLSVSWWPAGGGWFFFRLSLSAHPSH